MNSRQRLAKILSREVPDRVAIDFGAGRQTGIAASTVYRIKKHYGLLEQGERIKLVEPFQVLGEIDDELLDFLGLDVVGVHPAKNMFGFEDKDYKPWTLFDGTPVMVPGLFNTQPGPGGSIVQHAEGDKSLPPSAVMPKGGFYFDAIIRQNHFDENNLRPEDNCEEFGLLTDKDLAHFARQVDDYYRNTDKGIYMTFPGAAFGDIALVPGTFLKDPKGIRDIAQWYMSIALRPEYLKTVFQIQSEVALENLKALYQTVGDKVQVVFMSGTDFGSQNGPMLSELTYCDLYLPYQKRLNDWIHENTNWKTFIHSCGSIEPLLNAIIDAGFDILNPVQCSAQNMDPATLKARYGHRIVFWGGGVDTQKTLPFGTPKELYAEVTERIKILKQGGGYVFNAVHNVQAGVPPENFAAMMDAFRDNCDY